MGDGMKWCNECEEVDHVVGKGSSTERPQVVVQRVVLNNKEKVVQWVSECEESYMFTY